MCGMKLLIHSQTSTVAPLRFRNGCNYLSMLGLKLNHVSKRGLSSSWGSMPLASYTKEVNLRLDTKEVNPRLAKHPLKTNRRLTNLKLTSLVKEATDRQHLLTSFFTHPDPAFLGLPHPLVTGIVKSVTDFNTGHGMLYMSRTSDPLTVKDCRNILNAWFLE